MIKRSLFILTGIFVFIVSFAMLGRQSYAASGFVTTNGRNLMLNGDTFKSIGVNRYNIMTTGGTPFVGCGGTFSDTELNTWFSELHDMGVTSVRFWLFQQFTKSGADLNRFNTLLSLAQQYNVKLIPVFENQWADCTQGGQKTVSWYQSGYKAPYGSYPLSLKDYIGKVVPNYANNPNILMWQIMNEAEDSDTTSFYNFAKDVSEYIKSLDGNHLVSFGTMGSGQPGSSVYKQIHALSSIDVLEYHDYNSQTTAYPSTLQDRVNDSTSLNKPLIVGEAGIDMNDGYSASQRSSNFDSKMAAYFNNGGSNYLIWSYRDMDGKDVGYDFNYTDPLVSVIKNYTKDFNSTATATITPTQMPTSTPAPILTVTPTSSAVPTSTPTLAPTSAPTSVPTSAPTSAPTPTPATVSSTKLGGLNLSAYSKSLGYGPHVSLVNGIWVFSTSSQVIDMDSACQWQYKKANAIAIQTQPGNPYSWTCYVGQTSTAPNTPTGVTPTGTAPTATTSRLGGLDLSSYSSSLGYGSNVTIVNGVWVSTSNGKAIDMNAACQWQYQTTKGFAIQTQSGNAYSWVCYSQ